MANLEHVAVVKQGTEAIAAWRAAHPEQQLELEEADFQGANLEGANLEGANLEGANLEGANLEGANLEGANLFEANLKRASLYFANLKEANLVFSNLEDSNLGEANLKGVRLAEAFLSKAYLGRAQLEGALLDLSQIYDRTLEDVNFSGVEIAYISEFKNNIEYLRSNTLGSIVHSIEFPPEYHQAGIGILQYFSTILRQKYPNIPATVQITQDKLTVRMSIESDDGNREIIEKTLEEYGLVVAGKQQPATFLADEADIIRLETQLKMARLQIETEQKLRQLGEKQYEQRIESLEGRVTHLLTLVGDSLQHSQQALQHEQLQADRLIDVLEAQARAPLRPLLDRGLTEADEAAVKRLLTEAGQQHPRLLQRLAEGIAANTIGSTIGGTNAVLLAPWLQEVANQLGIVIRLAF